VTVTRSLDKGDRVEIDSSHEQRLSVGLRREIVRGNVMLHRWQMGQTLRVISSMVMMASVLSVIRYGS
jgi:hypothetical protein